MELSKKFNDRLVGVCHPGIPNRKYFDKGMNKVDSYGEAELVSFCFANPKFVFVDLSSDSGNPIWVNEISNDMIDWMCDMRSVLSQWGTPEFFDPED